MKAPQRILVVDDDPIIRRIITHQLRQAGYETLSAVDGETGLRQFHEEKPALVILDVNMPKMDGWTTCQRIREISDVPIIMLTAEDDESDIVRGLDIGADDYVIKPFKPKELLARVRASLRRGGDWSSSQDTFTYHDSYLSVDLTERRVSVKDEPVKLSRTEFNLLAQLVANPGKVMSFEDLLKVVWGPEYIDEVDYLRVYLSHLRRKIEEDPQQPRYLLSARGVGYRFQPNQ
jgi:two-component system, OmpR family, KDP operon response regulator KdpE